VDRNQVRTIGEIVTPWPCFVISIRSSLLQEGNKSEVLKSLRKFLDIIQESCRHFRDHEAESLQVISQECGLTADDSKKWFDTVKFSVEGAVSRKVMYNTLKTLVDAGALHDQHLNADIDSLYNHELTKIVS